MNIYHRFLGAAVGPPFFAVVSLSCLFAVILFFRRRFAWMTWQGNTKTALSTSKELFCRVHGVRSFSFALMRKKTEPKERIKVSAPLHVAELMPVFFSPFVCGRMIIARFCRHLVPAPSRCSPLRLWRGEKQSARHKQPIYSNSNARFGIILCQPSVTVVR